MAHNAQYAAAGAAVVAADEGIKSLNPEDEGGTGDNVGPEGNAPQPPARPQAPGRHEMADAYASNFNMLYRNDADGRIGDRAKKGRKTWVGRLALKTSRAG